MVAASPRVADFGLANFLLIYRGTTIDGIQTYGLILTVLAVTGLILARRRRSVVLLALLWLGSAALSLGSSLRIGTDTLCSCR